MVPPFVLMVLKVALLLLLYFFVWRAVRTVALDLRGRTPRQGRERRGAEPKPAKRGRGTPTKLVMTDERGTKSDGHRLAGTLRIGRAAECEIRLSDTYASQEHARISQRNGVWVIEDLGSTNGTYLNQRKVTVPTELAPGDRIRIGNTHLEVRR